MGKETVLAFVDAINTQNLPLFIQMMAEDFCFIDIHGGKEIKQQMKTD